MGYAVLFHPDVYEDLNPLPHDVQETLLNAVNNRLATEPLKYGKRLSRGLKGFWKLRVGHYRVLYKVVEREVWILKIGHRKEVYEGLGSRRSWAPR